MIRLTLALFTIAALGCNWEPCADAHADFTLAAPGDSVELLVHACGAEKRDLELRISLQPDRPPAGPLAIEVDDVEFYATGDTWGSEHNFSDEATDADCDPGRRITVHRLDADATVSISGTLVAEMSAPKRKTCTADISVTPSP